MDLLTPIFLLHGLGAHTYTLAPLEWYLNHQGFSNTHKISYPVDTMDFDGSLDYVDRELLKIVDKDQEIVLIGQSMGGVISNNLHRKGWKIKNAVYIGSPLHGANLLNQLEAILPRCIRNALYKLPYDYLKTKARDSEPPHPYQTVTMGWAYSKFDGCVYQNEAILDPDRNTHLAWADHRTIFANPRLWILVNDLMQEIF